MHTPDWSSIATGAVVAALFLLVGCPPNGEKEKPSWSEAFPADEFGWILSVAGTSGDAVYAVGGQPDSGRVKRFDGDSWSDVSIPSDVPRLAWVHAFEDGRPVMVGRGGTVLWRRREGWEVQEAPTDELLWGVWGASREHVWAVGGDGISGPPVAVRYDGSSWSKVALPQLKDVHALFKVWGTGPENVYMVGQEGTILHWDGQKIRDESPAGEDRDLISLWGTGPDRIAVVGGRGNGVLALWDGSKWSVKSLRPLIGMNGIWVPNDETAWVAGASGTVAKVDLTSDELERSVTKLETTRDIHAIFGLPGTGLFAVGGNLGRPNGPFRGTAWMRPSVE